ncbi:PAS domain-containing sensor histidine kinase [Ktedonobacter racemifer]|uniref:histidine kinase n=1 Tax=Ktedonobacter racemifer DSM 44963 TaxID=485913 RepID=D6U8E4_KTERA|nr:PAS domain-containing sensor histidine kinase [Ktedonobacter racemifer]EFH80155.1 PAS/PAC sensor signal transduction histidine kinase [Ktedonobacter racemifer DSM 44963]
MLKTRQIKRLTPESHETLLTILEALPGALFVLDDASTIIYANASAQALTGVAPETLVGNSFWRCAPQLVSTALYQAIQKTKQTRALTEVQYVSPVTGSWLHVHLSPTAGGLTLQFHEMEAPAHRQEIVHQRGSLSMDVLKNMRAGIAFLTPDGIVLDLNEVLLDDAHIRREEVVGNPLVEGPWCSSSPASQAQLRAAIARASMGETVRFETLVHPREGMELSLDVAITPHSDAEHHIEYLVLAGVDITTRKRAEAELHALIDAIPQQVWTMRPDGYIDYSNQRWLDYTGLSTEQAQGDGWIQCLHPDDQQRIGDAWQMSRETGTPFETEQRLRHGTTGAYHWFLARAMPMRDKTGQIIKWFGTCTDIHDKKQAEDEIRVLVDAIPHLVWIKRPDGSAEYANQRWRDYTNMTAEQAQGDGWLHAIHPDDQQRVLEGWQRSVQTGMPYEAELRMRHGTTGEYRWFLVRAMLHKDAQGTPLKWFGTCTDIDDRKRVEHQLKESWENWRVLAETVPQFVWTTQPDGSVEYWSQRWYDYTGSSPEQALGQRWNQFLHPDDDESTLTIWRHALEAGESYEIEYRLKEGQTGEYRWFLTRGMPVRDETGQILKWFGTCTDIEDQKRIETALRQSQERASILMNSNIIGINVIEGEQIVDANDAFLHMTGYTREDLRARHMNWLHMTAPEYLDRTCEAHQELAAQQSLTPYEKEYVCKDGSRLPVLVGGVALEHHPRQAISYVLDNSARKELEQRKDAFISMASHELRNPLAALKLQATLLHRQLARQGLEASAPALSRMQTQINTVTRLVEELLDVSKIQAGRLEYIREAVNLDALLREVADTMQQIKTTHTVVVRGATFCSLVGDKDRLGQVFTNLLSNAIKYSPDARTVEMELSATEDAVTVRVRDHGLGIPQEQRDKIFERFYRAVGPRQPTIPGLGMGLYIVAEIVKGHGGTITVDSAAGKGSTFTVTLPKRRDT